MGLCTRSVDHSSGHGIAAPVIIEKENLSMCAGTIEDKLGLEKR